MALTSVFLLLLWGLTLFIHGGELAYLTSIVFMYRYELNDEGYDKVIPHLVESVQDELSILLW